MEGTKLAVLKGPCGVNQQQNETVQKMQFLETLTATTPLLEVEATCG